MSKRSRARALAAMIERNVTGAPHARQPVRSASSDSIRRTTISAPSSVVLELRQLALFEDCSLNDLFLVAIEDFMMSIGHEMKMPLDAELRQRIAARRQSAASDAETR